jgi:phosphorylase kinase alpha/beta subunit
MVVNNEIIKNLIKPQYNKEDIENILFILNNHETFDFRPLNNGLFSAVPESERTKYTGYSYVWVRDNIHVAHAHYVSCKQDAAVKTLGTLMEYFYKHKHRFENIIENRADFNNPMERPHIRFDGNTLSEVNQKWAHAQNDAMGYFLWLFCKCACDGFIALDEKAKYMLPLFAKYFDKVKFWQDEDSGHWEEVRKISASSIGTAVAGLEMLKRLRLDDSQVNEAFLDNLINMGKNSLYSILPFECRQAETIKNRRYDAALLFLIYPLNILDAAMSDAILTDTIENLKGEYGIKRYIGDSYWAADYKKKIQENLRTADFSETLEQRDTLLKAGEEAQWCIFDPIISVIYGIRYSETADDNFLKLQTYFFNRSLGQLTYENHPHGGMKCPESYYLENGKYVTNDIVPLLWAKANLMLAINQMKKSL